MILHQGDQSLPVEVSRMVRIIQPVFLLHLSGRQQHPLNVGIIVGYLDHQNRMLRHYLLHPLHTLTGIRHHIEHPVRIHHIKIFFPCRHLRKQFLHISLLKAGKQFRVKMLQRVHPEINSFHTYPFIMKMLQKKALATADIQKGIALLRIFSCFFQIFPDYQFPFFDFVLNERKLILRILLCIGLSCIILKIIFLKILSSLLRRVLLPKLIISVLVQKNRLVYILFLPFCGDFHLRPFSLHFFSFLCSLNSPKPFRQFPKLHT